MTPIGFSIAIFSQSAFAKAMKNLIASSLFFFRWIAFSPYRSTLNQRFPVAVKYVQGGKAIIMSHFSFSNGMTSCCKCHSGCPPEHSWISQEYASFPRRRSSMVTACDSSHATRIFMHASFLHQSFLRLLTGQEDGFANIFWRKPSIIPQFPFYRSL